MCRVSNRRAAALGGWGFRDGGLNKAEGNRAIHSYRDLPEGREVELFTPSFIGNSNLVTFEPEEKTNYEVAHPICSFSSLGIMRF